MPEPSLIETQRVHFIEVVIIYKTGVSNKEIRLQNSHKLLISLLFWIRLFRKKESA